MGIKISSLASVADTADVGEYKIPCSGGDGEAKVITPNVLLTVCKNVLGINSIEDFSTTKLYIAGKAGDGYCIYNNKLYRFTSSHNGVWNDADVEETSLYNELLNFYSQTFESVTVYVSVADNGFSVSDLEVGLTLEDGTTFTYITDNEGKVSFTVERGVIYTLSMSAHEGYLSVSSKKFCSQFNSRNVYFVYNPTSTESTMETVNVAAGISTGVTSILTGTQLSVTCNNETTLYDFDGEKWSFQVPQGSIYTISMPTVTGWRMFDVNSNTYTASLTTRYIYGATYYYIGTDELIAVLSDGSTKTASTLTSTDNVEFIHVATSNLTTANADFYIKLSVASASKKWRASNTKFYSTNLTTTTSSNTAKIDYNGLQNTNAIRAELVDLGETLDSNYILPHIDALEAVTDHDGKSMNVFVMSLGLFYELLTVYSVMQSMYKALGKSIPLLTSSGWWTSTLYNELTMWNMYNGSPTSGYLKTSSFSVLPVYAY